MIPQSRIQVYATRLTPGQDVRQELVAFARQHSLKAVSIVSAVGSLSEVTLRYANQKEGIRLIGPFEVVSLTGTISVDGPHLHVSVSDKTGQTLGGHLMDGAKVFTTMELTLIEAEDLVFRREVDPATTYPELSVQPRKK